MPVSLVLDVLLVLLLLGYITYGYQSGLVRSLSAILGVVAGAVAAFFAIPFINSLVPDSGWRIATTIALALFLVLGGHAVGASIGYALGRRVKGTGLRFINRLSGAVVGGAVAALATSLIAFSISALGVPFLSPAIASSTVLRTIDSATPDPAKAIMAQLRSLVAREGVPLIIEAIGGPLVGPVEVPDLDLNTEQLRVASESVVRITGNAFACGQSQSGSGFVVHNDRVVTNAHVVAGVTDPIVEVRGGPALPGKVVYFDPQDDLAVILVAGLTVPPLDLGQTLEPGDSAVTAGYPFGGPFRANSAEIMSVSTVPIADIYGENSAPRNIYQLGATVEQGDSGGPLLTLTGEVVGVVFAKAANSSTVGYAVTMEELTPVATEAPTLSQTVSSGTCARG